MLIHSYYLYVFKDLRLVHREMASATHVEKMQYFFMMENLRILLQIHM